MTIYLSILGSLFIEHTFFLLVSISLWPKHPAPPPHTIYALFFIVYPTRLYRNMTKSNLKLPLTAGVELLGAGHCLDQLLDHDPVVDPNVARVHLDKISTYICKLNDIHNTRQNNVFFCRPLKVLKQCKGQINSSKCFRGQVSFIDMKIALKPILVSDCIFQSLLHWLLITTLQIN